MQRIRFYLSQDKTGGDYRPVIWPIKYPYWCAGETGDGQYFILVAYVDSLADLRKQWPEAENLEIQTAARVEFSTRFPRPDWYKDPEV